MDKHTGIVILAAGKGTRLGCTDKPKVMLDLAGKPIVAYIVETLESMGYEKDQIVLVVGFQQQVVRDYFGDRVVYAVQEEQRGTAHAAFIGMKKLPEGVTDVLVVAGDDSAFYYSETLDSFISEHERDSAVLSLLTAQVDDPSALGRILRKEDGSIQIIEKENITHEQEKINEISTGTFCFKRQWFEDIFPTMPVIDNLNEYGLPTTLEVAMKEGARVKVTQLKNVKEWYGINTLEQLAEARKRKQYE